jgi:hypothetical protein
MQKIMLLQIVNQIINCLRPVEDIALSEIFL